MGLCDALTLLITIAFDILWVGISVLATVVWIALTPSLLSTRLVVLVVGVGLQLEALPLTFTLALATGR
ncbi:MAG: hypothetical protein WCK93_10245 [Nitrosomonadales bacterium]